MKKWVQKTVCVLSACLLAVSMAACGGNDNGGNDGSAGSAQTAANAAANGTETPDTWESSALNNPLCPAYDLGGVTLTVLNQSDLAEFNPAQEGIEEYKIQERLEALDYIQNKYNVKLEFVNTPTDDWDELAAEVVSAYASGNPIADIMDSYYQFVGTYVANDILYDFTEDLADNKTFTEESKFVWMNRVWGLANGIGGEGLYYNKEWIRKMGMEYTPAEMFDLGKWSYDDCYHYLLEMKSHMAEDEYPMFVSPYYWMLFATAANGEIILDPSGNLNYTSDALIETLEFFEKCLKDGLIAPADKTEDGAYDTWGYPGNTFDAGKTVAIAHRAAWQAGSLVGKFELGFVPYPWGSNVAIGSAGNPGDYKTLDEKYAASYYDGQLLCLTKGVEKKADPVAIMSMLIDWRSCFPWSGWDDFLTAYEDDGVVDQSSCTWLEDGIDKDLYFYSLDRERLEPFNSLDLELSMSPNDTLYGGASIRSAMESYYNADMAALIDAGYASADAKNQNEAVTPEDTGAVENTGTD